MDLVASRSFIGIDPGVEGAIAVIAPDGSLELHSMPVAAREYLVQDLRDLLSHVGPAVAVIERPVGSPGMGTFTSGFKQGLGVGLIEGILAGLSMSYQYVSPLKWKRALGIPAGSPKDVAKPVAQRLFPAQSQFLGKRRADFADAALLAEWCRRVNR